MRYRHIVFLIFTAAPLAGCAGQLDGVPRVIDKTGPVQPSPATYAPTDLRQRFSRAVWASAAAPGDQTLAESMVSSGMVLARANCDDFFVTEAHLQRRADLAHDTIAPVISLLTSIVALSSAADHDRYIRMLSIGSTTALAGISLVDQHFLFGAENIKEVRDLTFQAVDVHEAAIEAQGTANFEAGVQQLIDHQVVCTPSNILLMTKQAIAAGQVSAEPDIVSSEDELALSALASALDLIGEATPKQAAAVWVLYKGGVDAAVPDALVAKLKDAQLGKLVTPAVAEVAAANGQPATPAVPAKLSELGIARKDAVMAALKMFSPGTQAKLQEAAASTGQGRAEGDMDIALAPPPARTRSIKLVVH